MSNEVTARALAAGVAIGAVLSVGNVYLGLKTGMWDGGAITAAILAFAIFAPLARLGVPKLTKLETNLAQTTASACAAMPAAMGLLGALPALDLLGKSYSDVELAVWGLAVGLLGIAVAVPLRDRLVVEEKLPYPTATATREVIDAVYASGESAYARIVALAGAAAFAMSIAYLRDSPLALFPSELLLPFMIGGVPLAAFHVGLAPSPMMISVGVLIGLKNCVGLLIGSITAWIIAAPILLANGAIETADYSTGVVWLLWPGVAMMLAGSFVSQLPALAVAARSVRDLSAKKAGGRWIIAVLVTGAAVAIAARWTFGVSLWVSAIIVVASVLACGLCARSSGETDIAPLASVGQATQLAIALLSPGGAAAVNLASASVVSGSAAGTVQTMQAFKVGEELGAQPKRQLVGAVIGAIAGAIVCIPAYRILARAYGVGSEALPAPFALGWKLIAELGEKGTANMPPGAGWAALAGLVIGASLALLEKSKLAKYVPSPLAIGVAFLLPASTVMTVAVGAIAIAIVASRFKDGVEKYSTSAAAGAIAGEGVMSLLVAFSRVTGLL